MDWPAAVVVD